MSILVILPACTNVKNSAAEVNKLQLEQSADTTELRKETEHFQFYCAESDAECLKDLAETLEGNYSRITSDLNADLGFKVKVYLYKDINTFHKAIGQIDAPDWVVGAAFGNDIQMVSPLRPGRIHNYDSLIKVVVHEFTHVVIKNISSPEVIIPQWLNEGVATYEAKQTDQLYGIGKLIRLDRIPSIETLESNSSYDAMSDNKLYQFSYTLAEFIINKYGIEKLNNFIRSPSDYSGILGVDNNDFEQAWKDYLKVKYISYE